MIVKCSASQMALSRLVVFAWAWLALPLVTGHLNVLISQAEVMKLLGKIRFDYKLLQYQLVIKFETISLNVYIADRIRYMFVVKLISAVWGFRHFDYYNKFTYRIFLYNISILL